MRRTLPRERLDRVMRGLDDGEFELLEFSPTRENSNVVVIRMALKQTSKHPVSGSERRTPKRRHNKDIRELIFDDEEDGGDRGC